MFKKTIQRVLVAALVCSVVGAHGEEALRVATIDLGQVFSAFYKSQEAAGKVEAARVQAKKEFDERGTHLSALEAQVASLSDEVNRPGLAGPKLYELVNLLNSKLQESQELRDEIQSFGEARERQISEMGNRFRGAILEEINRVIARRVAGYDLVFDSSSNSVDEVKVVLFHKVELDLTEEVSAELARSAPKVNP